MDNETTALPADRAEALELKNAIDWMDRFIAEDGPINPDGCLLVIRKAALNQLAALTAQTGRADAEPVPVMQTALGRQGNCMAACFSTLLGIPLSSRKKN